MTSSRLLSERYELGDTLGYGGMSEVHRGRDVRLSRDVAVKVLRADLARDPQFQLRFRREAQNAAALNHPAIVAVYDTGETNGEMGTLPYIVMEFVDGQTLREIVKGTGPLSQQRVLEVMADVCAALDFSHRHGIIHRDVKPANVMITTAGAVKVMDFGIARALSDSQNMTQTAAVIGTAQYLSPEQARGEAVDARSDVYAAGCVLFELLTGEPPFSGDSPVAVAYQHVREDVRQPSEVNPDVGPELDAVVLKAMSKNPANRYQSAAEMRTDLVRALRGQRPLAPQVMSEDERTALITDGGAGTRGLGAVTNRHTAPPAWDEQRAARRITGKKVGTVLGAAAVLALIVFVATRLFGGPGAPEQVGVRDVAGKVTESAREQLISQGLKPTIKTVPSPDSPQVPAGQAIRTEPPAGTQVDKGKVIDLYISKGPAQVSVPNLTGKSQADAQQALLLLNLTLAPTPTRAPTSDPNQVDKVIDQSPKPGQNVPGQSPVTITIGQKQQSVKIPAGILGERESDARAQLEALASGLTVNSTRVDGPGEPDTVYDTDPKPGKDVPVNGTITMTITRGNEDTMPNVLGKGLDDAKRMLKDAGVRSSNIVIERAQVNDANQADRVIKQSPSGDGQGIPRDSDVTLTVGEYNG
ncbi:MAG: Stk1 family PASTA domain-containing Ser/Thr kinase [Actinomycetota bacterium]|nr:Stk1 family PASTA domain-containing Ser/Thr kinase [Actinomycetota bacterium]